MTKEQQVNEIAKKIGMVLVDSGTRMIQSAFHLTPVKVSGSEINDIVRHYFPSINITHLDGYYYLLPLAQWKELIRVDWTDTKKWILDARDCDNFSNAFASNMSIFYECNSAGLVYGKFYKGMNNFVGYHYWNIIITAEKEIWFFEPSSDKLTEAKYQGGVLLIGGNKYEVVSMRFG